MHQPGLGWVVWTAIGSPDSSVCHAAQRLRQRHPRCVLRLIFTDSPPAHQGPFQTITRASLCPRTAIQMAREDDADWLLLLREPCRLHPLAMLRMLAAAQEFHGLVFSRPFPYDAGDSALPQCLLITSELWELTGAGDACSDDITWLQQYVDTARRVAGAGGECGNAYVLPACFSVLAHGKPARLPEERTF